MDNKKLVETVAANLGRSTEDVTKLLDALAGVLSARCADMDSVHVPGFGSFEPKMHQERVTLDANGQRTLVPPKVALTFKVSNVLKAKIK
jgi:nucleoid DNA-binding protein